MSAISDRAEEIASFLAHQALGAEILKLPNGSVMDFSLHWSDGRRGFLEVTTVAHPDAIGWQDQLAAEGGVWPAPGKWELRLSQLAITYRPTRDATLYAIALCDRYGVDGIDDLPPLVQAHEPDIVLLRDIGELRRAQVGRDGVAVFVPTRAEWPDEVSPDFSRVLMEWAVMPHIARHIEKTRVSSENSHLFLVPLDDVLPSRFFTHEFDAPATLPTAFEGLAGLWVWSNFWHRFLGWQSGQWRWYDWSNDGTSARHG